METCLKKTMALVCLLFGRVLQCFVSFPQAAVHRAPWEEHQKSLRKPSEKMNQVRRNAARMTVQGNKLKAGHSF